MVSSRRVGSAVTVSETSWPDTRSREATQVRAAPSRAVAVGLIESTGGGSSSVTVSRLIQVPVTAGPFASTVTRYTWSALSRRSPVTETGMASRVEPAASV